MKSIVGFFNRPWVSVPLDQELAGIAATGSKHAGLLGKHGGGIWVEWDTPLDEVARIKDAIAAHGLNMNALLAHARFDVSTEESVKCYKAFIDRAAALGTTTLLEMGAHELDKYAMYYDVMQAVSPYAQDKGMMVAVKPHGGLTSTGKECAQLIERVGHPNYRLWYDAGNILYYKHLDPVAEAAWVKGVTVGMCVKDCVIDADGKADVDVTPGEGQVDFPGVFKALWDGGLKGGSFIVETLGSGSYDEITAAGKKAYGYIRGEMAKVGYDLE
ncbi:MAG: sugar phosphate isomerase/epimerase family protein [Anaerolineae bacterium]